MNDNHQRRLLATFQHVDNLLAEVEQILAGSPSPFQEYAPDATQLQRRETHESVLRLRETMRRILPDLDIPLNPPVCGALWAARSHLAFARVAAMELGARRMRAYGTVSPAGEKLFDPISSELQERIRSLEHCLGGNGEDDSPPELP